MVDRAGALDGLLVLQVRIHRVGRAEEARVVGVVVAVEGDDRGALQRHFVELHEAVAVGVVPGERDARGAHRVQRARQAARRDLAVVDRERRAQHGAAGAEQVVADAEARRPVRERHAGVGALEVDAGQPLRNQRIGLDRAGERLVVLAVPADAGRQRQLVAGVGVLREQAVRGHRVVGRRTAPEPRALGHAVARLRRHVAAVDRRRRRRRVAEAVADLERVVATERSPDGSRWS